jgi:hypothetical protein
MQRILSECAAFQAKLADAHAANDARRAEVEKLRTEVLAVGDQLKCFTPGSRNHAESVLSTTTIDEAQALFGRRVAYEHDVDITDEILARLIPPKNCIAIPRAD